MNGYLLKCRICIRKKEKRTENLLLGEEGVFGMCKD
jgi:hypothetical protein